MAAMVPSGRNPVKRTPPGIGRPARSAREGSPRATRDRPTYNCAVAKLVARPHPSTQSQVLNALRGIDPSPGVEIEQARQALKHYECGGYVHSLWRRLGRKLPEPWGGAAAALHRTTMVDSLSAVAQLREVAEVLRAEGIDFLLLKGAAYLADLYPDVGARALVDVDLLIQPDGTTRLARRLLERGFAGEVGAHYPEDERFEMFRPGRDGHCRFEFHWRLGGDGRNRLDQEALWRGAAPMSLDGLACRRLGVHEAIVYHVGHAGDHYFGPGLKWTIDLREMLRQWRPSPDRLARLASEWGLRTPLHLALLQLDRIFPGEAPADLLRATAPGPLRRKWLSLARSDEPAEFFRAGDGTGRWLLRPLLIDAPGDVLVVSARVLRRPFTKAWRRFTGPLPRPWEARA